MNAIGLIPAGIPDRLLSAFTGAAGGGVREKLDAAEFLVTYQGIARMSGHLAAMWRAVYPQADRQPGMDGRLQAACRSHARQVEWTLRLLERRLSGDASAVSQPITVLADLLAGQLDRYWVAEQALVTGMEDPLSRDERARIAGCYLRALTRAPTRPHPRRPRSGPLCRPALWLHSRWDRLLDTMDSRAGVGRGFLASVAREACAPAASRPAEVNERPRGRSGEEPAIQPAPGNQWGWPDEMVDVGVAGSRRRGGGCLPGGQGRHHPFSADAPDVGRIV